MNRGERLVIVGGGPAGLSTARTYRESGGKGRVEILAAENFAPYRRPPLTKEYLRGEISREDLPMESPAWFWQNNIELHLATPATAIDRERQIVETANGDFPYDVCVLATGSEPVRLPVPGGDDPEIMVMRTVEHSTCLQEQVKPGGRAAIIGSGFIGCEAAASLSMRGAEVALVSMEDLPQEQRLGADAGKKIQSWLEGYGVELHPGVSVEGIERDGDSFVVGIEGGDEIRSDTVLFGTGVKPRTGLAEATGLAMSHSGVICDSSMRTSASGIFAVGDIAYAHNEAAGRRLRVEHWGEALNHGRVAGTVISGGEAVWDIAPGFWSTIGDKTLKYAAWGDGWDEARFVDQGDGAFTVWYGREGACVGVLTHGFDEDYENGRELVETGAPLPG